MSMFSRHTKQNRNEITPVLQEVIMHYRQAKEKLAVRLQGSFERLSATEKKWMLLLFCLAFSAASVMVMLYPSEPVQQQYHQTQPMGLSGLKKEEHMLPSDSLMDSAIRLRVQRLKAYLEALQQHAEGRKEYDSLMQARPQLMDSIELFEKMYLSKP